MPDQILVNIRSTSRAIRREKRAGRDVIIVPSATLPDNIVMNGIKYPAEEIERSYRGLNRTPAPLGHPKIDGKFVSARDPEAINLGWIGAFNENVRREGGRVLLDKVIDVERANQTEGGKRVLAVLAKGGPVHTSTGVFLHREAVTNASDHKFVARNLVFDHDAILLDEPGAATPEQGVGMMVNSDNNEPQEIEVINSSLEGAGDGDFDRAMVNMAKALVQQQTAGVVEQLKTAFAGLFGKRELSANQEKADMADQNQLDALSAKIDGLPAAFAKAFGDLNLPKTIGETVTNAVKPLIDAQAALAANQKEKDDTELGELREKIIKANLMDEDGAKELTLNAARALVKKAKPGAALNLNSKVIEDGDKKPSFSLPKAEK